MIKYKIEIGWSTIKPVEIEKETKASVWVNGRRCAKRTNYENYFDSWEEAKQCILAHAQKKVDRLRYQLERAKGELGDIEGMKPQA